MVIPFGLTIVFIKHVVVCRAGGMVPHVLLVVLVNLVAMAIPIGISQHCRSVARSLKLVGGMDS